jgi:hypothetical protein
MSSSDEDLNIQNYDDSELLELLGLNDTNTDEDINFAANEVIRKYSIPGNENPMYVRFFTEARNKLLAGEELDNSIPIGESEQSEVWFTNQYLQPNDQNQADKITTRGNNTETFKTGVHNYMKQELLGITNTIPLEVSQDTLNPVLRQVIWRHITIDSKYRPYSIPYSFDPNSPNGTDTNFTFSLTESLKNVLKIQLKSLYIPGTWYPFDKYINNTSFTIQYLVHSGTKYPSDLSWNQDASCCPVYITEGKYPTVEALVKEINHDISLCCPDLATKKSWLRIVIQNDNVMDKLVQFINLTKYWIRLVFFEPDTGLQKHDCSGCTYRADCSQPSSYLQNLGYYLGYRILNNNTFTLSIVLPPLPPLPTLPGNFSFLRNEYIDAIEANNDTSMNIVSREILDILKGRGPTNVVYPQSYYELTDAGIVLIGAAPVPVDLVGGEYLILVLNDFTQNFPNNGLVGIGQPETKLDLPSYAMKLSQDFSVNICDLSANEAKPPPLIPRTQYVPTFPRKLTQAQLYSVNQIINNRKQPIDLQAPNPPDLFAIVNRTFTRPQFAEDIYNDPNTNYERTYFGPVTLERLGIKLLDSKGNLVNLRGHSWSFTLAVQQLYQY